MNMKQDALVLLGAIVGGAVGYAGFFWLVNQGLYGLVVPGGLLGLGAGVYATSSRYIPPLCGVMALILGIFTEWKFAPFNADESLSYFVAHLHQLKPMTLLMIGLGAAIGFWVPFRRAQPVNLKAVEK
jgi:hypothetical protein